MLEILFEKRKDLFKTPGTAYLMTHQDLVPFDFQGLRNKPLPAIVQDLIDLQDRCQDAVLCVVRGQEKGSGFELTVADTLFADWGVGILLYDPKVDEAMLFPAVTVRQKAAAISVET